MQSQLITVESLHNELLQLLPLEIENQKRLDKKFRLEFSYNSNHIEGNTLTYGETELLILFDDTKGNHTLREFEEMKSHDIAFLKINDWAKEDRDLTETDIKELNRIILVRDFWKEAITEDHQPTRRKIIVGNYKQHPNSVRLENGEMFDYASVTDTPILMRELIDWYKTEGKDFHPVVLAAIFHYKFVRIHPFDDGNGRVARLLLNYILLKNNFPPIVIKSNDKKNYLSALHQADLGDIEAFSKYILEQEIWSLELSIKAAKGENIDEANDWEKKLAQMKIRVTKEEFSLEFNQKTFDFTINTTISKLMQNLDIKLKDFKSLFQEHSFYIVSGDKGNSGNDFYPLFKVLYKQGFYDMRKIILDGYFKNLINSVDDFEIKIPKIVIDFKNSYFTISINSYFTENYSYQHHFTKENFDEIINVIGSDLIQKIEEAQK